VLKRKSGPQDQVKGEEQQGHVPKRLLWITDVYIAGMQTKVSKTLVEREEK
jgi:hypothetical protein